MASPSRVIVGTVMTGCRRAALPDRRIVAHLRLGRAASGSCVDHNADMIRFPIQTRKHSDSRITEPKSAMEAAATIS